MQESKEISSTVYTVSVISSPSDYAKVYLGKTSSEWTGAQQMATIVGSGNTSYIRPAWNSTDIWSNGNGTRVATDGTYAYATTDAEKLKEI